MKFKQHHDHADSHSDSSGEAPGGDALDSLRARGERCLDGGDDAIEGALSHNSQAFLAANRQENGQ